MPLYRCTIVPLCHCTAVSLYRCVTVPLYHCTAPGVQKEEWAAPLVRVACRGRLNRAARLSSFSQAEPVGQPQLCSWQVHSIRVLSARVARHANPRTPTHNSCTHLPPPLPPPHTTASIFFLSPSYPCPCASLCAPSFTSSPPHMTPPPSLQHPPHPHPLCLPALPPPTHHHHLQPLLIHVALLPPPPPTTCSPS